MKTLARLAICLVSIGLAAPAGAADFADPTWPCLQRKVGTLSIGLMWPNPIDTSELSREVRADVDELASTLVLRRIDMDAAQTLVTDFAETHERDPNLMGRVFEKVFNQLNARRSALIEGIGEFSLAQIAMAERIDEARTQMDTLMAADTPDYDKVDALEEQVDWDERIYTDRQRSLTFVCETPVLLEKRLYALAQMLMDAAQG